jgi:hypothetical protein
MKIIKIICGIILLIALLNNPYGYYQILRWVIMGASAYLAYTYFTSDNKKYGWVFLVVAVLFNPLWPFFFDKSTWQILDLITSGVFFISLKK